MKRRRERKNVLTPTDIDPSKIEKPKKAMKIILNVGDHVLQKNSHCTTTSVMCFLLKRLYILKFLPYNIFLQLKFYKFKMTNTTSVDSKVDVFLKLVSDLNIVWVMVTDEVHAILLICSLSSLYNQLKETLKYAKDTINDITQSILKSDFTLSNKKFSCNIWGLNPHGEWTHNKLK